MSKAINSNQVSVAITGQTLVVPANSNRLWLRISNLDAANAVYLGGPNVTTAVGDKLAFGQSVIIETVAAQAAVYAQAATGAVNVSYSEVTA